MQDSELLAYDLCYSDHTEGVMAVRYQDSQKWLYYKDMDRDELLTFKQYDTRGTFLRAHADLTGHASRHHNLQSQSQSSSIPSPPPFISCLSPHSSFLEPETSAASDEEALGEGGGGDGYPGRESIEAAVLILMK